MIPASHIVKVTPRVISGGSSDLETNGMLLTQNARIPTNQPAMEFSSASAVADFFGNESDEAKFAQQYFTGVTNQQKAVATLVIGRHVAEDAPAWIRGGIQETTLEEFKAITDGGLALVVNGTPVVAEGIDLSSATSLSEVATLVAAKLTGTVGAYDSQTQSFVFTTEKIGVDATLGFPDDSLIVSVGKGVVGKSRVSIQVKDTDLSTLLGLTVEQGAVISPGASAMVPNASLDAICTVTRNWVGFTTLWEASLEEAQCFAEWADIDDDYVYIDWTQDIRALNQLTQAETKPAKMMDVYNCTISLFGDWRFAAFVLAIGASIDWQRNQGMKAWFGKSASGLSPTVSDEASADALEKIRCSYFGNFATRNDRFQLFNTGELCSSYYGYIDVLYGSIYLRNAIQRSCMDGFTTVNRAPYNETGRAFISAWLQDPINVCLRNGVIDKGLSLAESQRVQIMQEVGQDISTTLFTKGYWVGIEMPSANVRAERGSPVVSIYYAYAGAIQRISAEIVSVI